MEVKIVVVVFEFRLDILTSYNITPVGVLASFTVVFTWTAHCQERITEYGHSVSVSKFMLERVETALAPGSLHCKDLPRVVHVTRL